MREAGEGDPFSLARTHEALVGDRVRMRAYAEAIAAAVRPGAVVLDLGCGTGILSLLAARAGARKVYAVDRAAILDDARETARRNGLEGRIEFIRSSFDDLVLPERVDLVIHELIGSRFWDERLLPAIAHARRTHLAPGGRLLPVGIDVFLAPTSHVSELERSLAFWRRKHHGLDLGAFGRLAFEQGVAGTLVPDIVALRDPSSFLAPAKRVLALDLRRASRLPGEVTTSFRLPRGGRLTGLCVFLRVHLDRRRSFSTGPDRTGTHWGQLFLPAFEPLSAGRGAGLRVSLSMGERASDWRWSLELARRPAASR
ncbi:MAG TPA: class I SAM-dependent methyltransferase [Vicinamibacteria bacterium]|nr:class I SAM-dependent methyltransferase [Vicinamibacteria bacterium]